MRLLILFIFIPLMANANFIKKSKLGDCSPGLTVYTSAKSCGVDCTVIPKGYNCEYYREKIILEMDHENGSFTKSEREDCLPVADDPLTVNIDESKTDVEVCEDKNAAKVCTDTEEKVYIRTDTNPMEIYCSKFTAPMIDKGLREIVEDTDLKAAYETAKAQKDALAAAIESERVEAESGERLFYLIKAKNKTRLTPAQRKQMRKDYRDILNDLKDGELCEAKNKIESITPDGTLIRAEDVTEIVAEIAKVKTCP